MAIEWMGDTASRTFLDKAFVGVGFSIGCRTHRFVNLVAYASLRIILARARIKVATRTTCTRLHKAFVGVRLAIRA